MKVKYPYKKCVNERGRNMSNILLKKDDSEVLTFDEFAGRCEYFYCYNGDTNFNNGYNCSHPDCEEIEEENGEKIGCCHSYTCPLAGQFTVGCDDDEDNE
jgi:hypothetical protein